MQKIILAILIAVLTGCDDKSDHGKKPSQIVAKIDADEVSVHQVNYALSRTNVGNQNIDQLKKQIVKSLVDETLLYRQALDEKMDREPNVLMAIEESKKQILAQSWLDKVSKSVPKPTSYQVEDYYKDHPELFAQHRIYSLKEIAVAKSSNNLEIIKKILSTSNNVSHVLAKFDENKIQYKQNDSKRGSESLPLEKLKEIAKLNPGEILVIGENEGVILLISVVSFVEESINKEKATPIIEAYINNTQRKVEMENALNKLRAKAKIEYLGDFTELNNKSTSEAAIVKQDEKKPTNMDNSLINRGINGL